jgi:hypothetical protein
MKNSTMMLSIGEQEVTMDSDQPINNHNIWQL